jgi:hypothetical protein
MDSLSKYNLDIFSNILYNGTNNIINVFEFIEDECLCAIKVCLSDKILIFSANPDDDTLKVDYSNEMSFETDGWRCISTDIPWINILGHHIDMLWITINNQGYCDGAIIGIDGLLPSIIMNVIASNICVFNITHFPTALS